MIIPKWVIRSLKSTIQRGKKEKGTNNDIQHTTKNIHSGLNSYAPGLLIVPALLVKLAVLLLKD